MGQKAEKIAEQSGEREEEPAQKNGASSEEAMPYVPLGIKSEEDVFKIPGDIRLHFKGGYYLKCSTTLMTEDFPANINIAIWNEEGIMKLARITDPIKKGERAVLYRHLYPYENYYYVRPEESFEERFENGKARFERLRWPEHETASINSNSPAPVQQRVAEIVNLS